MLCRRITKKLLGEEHDAAETAANFPLGEPDPEDEGLLEIVLDELASEGQLPPESMPPPALLLSKFRRVSGDGFDARIGVTGGSQGGGLTLAVAGLDRRPSLAMADVPFLCHFERPLDISDAYPYRKTNSPLGGMVGWI